MQCGCWLFCFVLWFLLSHVLSSRFSQEVSYIKPKTVIGIFNIQQIKDRRFAFVKLKRHTVCMSKDKVGILPHPFPNAPLQYQHCRWVELLFRSDQRKRETEKTSGHNSPPTSWLPGKPGACHDWSLPGVSWATTGQMEVSAKQVLLHYLLKQCKMKTLHWITIGGYTGQEKCWFLNIVGCMLYCC